jgi:hypothetical protein
MTEYTAPGRRKYELIMIISDLEAFFSQKAEGRTIRQAEERDELHKQFPHVVVTEGADPEIDFAYRWCWRTFGSPRVKECGNHGSEYPACPLVLATEYIRKGTYQGKDGVMKESQEKCYQAPERHGHDGRWATFWLGKTGYDYGFIEFCFSQPEDKEAFLAAAPSMGFGENYDVTEEDR